MIIRKREEITMEDLDALIKERFDHAELRFGQIMAKLEKLEIFEKKLMNNTDPLKEGQKDLSCQLARMQLQIDELKTLIED